MIAALYVEKGGCYFGLPGVDPWDEERDARLYAGPHPVVAHPPCERWGRFAEGSPMKRGYILGDDDGKFEAALRAVQTWGGVLEHPADTEAFAYFGLGEPGRGGWQRSLDGSWLTHVEQGHYGHPARKGTWLYAMGIEPVSLRWGSSGQRLPAKRLAERGYASARRCGAVGNLSHAQRRRTPIEFRDLLLSIARTVNGGQRVKIA